MSHPVKALLAELAKETWAMEPDRLVALFATLEAQANAEVSPKLLEARGSASSEPERPSYKVREGVAHIAITGVMMKRPSWWMEYLGLGGGSTQSAQRALAAALEDESVGSVLLTIESPGGSVSGTEELANDVYAAGKRKPVHAHIEDLGASAAYWVASQASRVTANGTALAGSIGVYRVMVDASKRAEKDGYQVHVVRSGEHKGAGAYGAPLTEGQIAIEQEIIDQSASMFVDAVARGRRLGRDTVLPLATGRVWLANEAKGHGLIDDVSSSRGAHERALPGAAVARFRAEQPVTAPSDGAEREAPVANEKPAVETAPQGQAVDWEKRLKESEARAAAFEKEAELSRAKLTEVQSQQKRDVIAKAQAEGRLAPAQVKSIEEYAAMDGITPERVAKFLESYPVLTRPNAVGSEPTQQGPGVDGSAATADDVKLFARLGTNAEAVKKYENVVSFSPITKQVTYADGRVETHKKGVQQ